LENETLFDLVIICQVFIPAEPPPAPPWKGGEYTGPEIIFNQ